jgi:hypothetical protein
MTTKELIYKGHRIVPDESMSGYTHAARVGKTFYVSPAIFELLQDPDSANTVGQQVKVIDVTKRVGQLMKEITSTQDKMKNEKKRDTTTGQTSR